MSICMCMCVHSTPCRQLRDAPAAEDEMTPAHKPQQDITLHPVCHLTPQATPYGLIAGTPGLQKLKGLLSSRLQKPQKMVLKLQGGYVCENVCMYVQCSLGKGVHPAACIPYKDAFSWGLHNPRSARPAWHACCCMHATWQLLLQLSWQQLAATRMQPMHVCPMPASLHTHAHTGIHLLLKQIE
jgi:hypothetical protein